MDKIIKNRILKILKDRCESMSLNDLVDSFDKADFSRVHHIVDVMEGDDLIEKNKSELSLLGFGIYYHVSLTAKGYLQFKSWYEKLWNFITDDFAKLLSLVSIILSILATYLSLRK